jgi:Predicted dehydrogenases and related proteins
MSESSQVWRVALIGISGYGRIHLQLARECRARGEVAIVAATVINAEEEAENIAELRAHGCTIYSDYEEMLREQRGRIDLCLIPTGIHWHARMTISALRAGANVLVEKPLAGSMADVEAVRAVERETGRFVAVGFQDLYEPGTVWLKNELKNGVIGAVRSVRFLGIWPRGRGYFLRNEWAGRTQVNGVPVFDSPLNNAFGHFVMLSLYFASPTAEAAAAVVKQAELFRAHRIESFDTAVVTSETADGVKLWFGVSHASRETEEPEIVIHGEKGTAGWRYEREAWWRDLNGGGDLRRLPDMTATRRSMMAAVLARMSDPAAPICGSEMASRHTAIIEAVHRSGAIREFPAKELNWVEDARQGSEVPEVNGLTIALRKAFETQQLLAQSGFKQTGSGLEQTRPV